MDPVARIIGPRLARRTPQDALTRPWLRSQVFVVRQKLEGYELGEISRVDNLEAGASESLRVSESVESEDRLSHTTDSLTSSSTERAERQINELRSEVERAADERSTATGALAFSSEFGSSKFEARGSFAIESGTQSLQRSASRFSSDVLDRAVRSMTERVVGETEVRTIRSTGRATRASRDGTSLSDNVATIYRWIDQVFEATTYQTKSERIVLELMLFDPGKDLRQRHAEGSFPPKPPKPTFPTLQVTGPLGLPVWRDITAASIARANWASLSARVRARNVPAPPEAELFVSSAFTSSTLDDAPDKTFIAQAFSTLRVPTGYEAVSLEVTISTAGASDQDDWLFYTVSTPFFSAADQPNEWYQNITESSEADSVTSEHPTFHSPTAPAIGKRIYHRSDSSPSIVGEVPVTVSTKFARGFVGHATIRCIPSDHTMSEWQATVFDRIVEAHQLQVLDWRQEQARAEVAQDPTTGVTVRSTEVEQAILGEIKRAAIGLLLRDTSLQARFEAVQDAPASDRDDLHRGYARLVLLLEQAIDWDLSTFVLYGGHWVDDAPWDERNRVDEADHRLKQFLLAGAVRLQLVSRAGFEGPLARFLSTGSADSMDAAWVPMPEDSDFLWTAEEFNDTIDDDVDDLTFVSSRRFRVPTTLMMIRPRSESETLLLPDDA